MWFDLAAGAAVLAVAGVILLAIRLDLPAQHDTDDDTPRTHHHD